MSTIPFENRLRQQRPQRAPFPSSTINDSAPSSAPNFPTRDASLRRRLEDSTTRDPHLEAALENRRRNGIPTGSRGAARPTISSAQGDEGGAAEAQDEALAEQFEDSEAGEARFGEEQETLKSQRESLTPLSQNATVSRMTSTRRYMDQLDEDDVEAMEEEEADREVGTDKRFDRESAASDKTFDSQSVNAFHYSMYGNMPSPVASSFPSSPHHLPSLLPSPIASSTAPLSPPSSASSPTTSAPLVRIGPPSPTTDSFLSNPQDSTPWNDPNSPPASPVSKNRQEILATTLASPPSLSNRARSQTSSKNFSRPFVSTVSAPNVPSSIQMQTTSAKPSSPRQRPVSPRTDSLESTSSPNPLDRKSSLGATSSSMGHSESSQGGHSMSASWEDRRFQGLKQHEEAKRAINLAREQSQRFRADRDFGNHGVEELKSLRGEEDNGDPYGGEEEEEVETSIHFPEPSQDSTPESPCLAYDAPSPPAPSEPFDVACPPQSVFSEELPRSPPLPLLSHQTAAFSSEPRPAPAPPIDSQPSISVPLSIPGSPPLRRRPSDSPSLTSFYSSTVRPAYNSGNLSQSTPSSASPHYPQVTTKQRNVLRKPRPGRRHEDEVSGLSAPMSRSGSALSSNSQASSSTGEPSSTWAKFKSRSRSKSRSRANAATSTFFDDPPPTPSPFLQQSAPPPPSLRQFAPSTSLQPLPPVPTFPSPSSTSPLSQADFARLQAARPAFLRSKTSFGDASSTTLHQQQHPRTDEWVLKSVTGPKSVQTGVVHYPGEAASVHGGGGGGDLGPDDEVEQLSEAFGLGQPSRPRLAGGGGSGSAMMGRSFSDQGPSTGPSQHVRSSSGTSSKGEGGGGGSVYSSTYSVYSLPPSPLDTSPTTSTNPVRFETSAPRSMDVGGHNRQNSTLQKAKETLGGGGMRGQMMRTPSGNEKRVVLDPVTPDDFLQVGIDHHEAGELERAAWCFEQSAKKDGGCGAGMLMYGLTLRHGWGCQINAPLGFRYLQMAAESVVEDLDRVVFGGRTLTESEANTKAAKSELVLALHEIGVSYRFGWGIEKNKKMALSYFTLSADLGDLDAQQDVAFCYANGKGCKKDLKRAAHYYRLAIAQGAENWGLSWIYKPKYMST